MQQQPIVHLKITILSIWNIAFMLSQLHCIQELTVLNASIEDQNVKFLNLGPLQLQIKLLKISDGISTRQVACQVGMVHVEFLFHGYVHLLVKGGESMNYTRR